MLTYNMLPTFYLAFLSYFICGSICFFSSNVGPHKESIFLTTFRGLYFQSSLHLYYKLHFFMLQAWYGLTLVLLQAWLYLCPMINISGMSPVFYTSIQQCKISEVDHHLNTNILLSIDLKTVAVGIPSTIYSTQRKQ